MAVTTLQFNNGNPFSVGPAGVHSAARTLPAVVDAVMIQITDPNGDYMNPANAGGTFVLGLEYTLDGGTNWKPLMTNGSNGQPIGSTFKGQLPFCKIGISGNVEEWTGMPIRAFATSTTTISIAASAFVTH
jgi:hypothetical protein